MCILLRELGKLSTEDFQTMTSLESPKIAYKPFMDRLNEYVAPHSLYILDNS